MLTYSSIQNFENSILSKLQVLFIFRLEIFVLDDIDKKIAFAKSKRGKMATGGLVDALSHRIDSIRKAVDDEEGEDDSGYVDEWEEGTDL